MALLALSAVLVGVSGEVLAHRLLFHFVHAGKAA